MFKVTRVVDLCDNEKEAIKNKEALFFYHLWTRTEFEMIEIAHDILSTHCDNGKNSNYNDTSTCRNVRSIQKQFECEIEPLKIRFNSSIDGKFEWVEVEHMVDVYRHIDNCMEDMITEIYGIDNYFCGCHEGDWGLFHSDIFEY